MNKLLISAAFLALGLIGAVREARMRGRIEELEQAPRACPETLAMLVEELETLDSDLADTRRSIERDQTDAKLTELEQRLGATGEELAAQQAQLYSWSSAWDGHDPIAFEEHLLDLDRGRQQDRERLAELTAAANDARAELARLEALDQSGAALAAAVTGVTDRDTERMWHELVGPVVQIAGDVTVGSGVLLESEPIGDGEYRTHLLTSWHVVRDIYGSKQPEQQALPVKLYLGDGQTVLERAHMVAYQVDIDIALLRLATTERIANGARLASRGTLSSVQVFDSVYAVGCPLGNDPIPTAGEIADTRHRIDGESYWMISAPTYIGNSGGGIFNAKTHELLGIFSKIYTHGGVRSTIVPHMGLVTPLETVYDWLESVDYAQLDVPGEESPNLPGVAVQAAGLDLESH